MGRTTTTLHDVARHAGVSKTTAAAILRDAPGLRASSVTRQRVLDASARLGYRRNAVAISLQKGRTQVIGVLLPESDRRSYASRAYMQDLLIAVLEAATSAGLRIIPVPFSSGSGEGVSVSSVTDRQVDGLIFGAMYNEDFRKSVESAGVPCVEISGFGPYVVHPDNRAGAEAAVEHLTGLGHRHIVFWEGFSGYASAMRRTGFEEAMARRGLSPRFVASEGDLAALLRQPARERPTAIITFNDHFACLALKIAREMGVSVPESLSVLGFDDKILAEIAVPPLTTIHNSLEEQARIAVEMLQCRLRGEEPAQPEVVVPVHLVVRESTASAPANA